MFYWLNTHIDLLMLKLCKYKHFQRLYIKLSHDMQDSLKEIRRNLSRTDESLTEQQVCHALWQGTFQNMPKSINDAKTAIKKHPLQSNSYEIYNKTQHRVYLLNHKHVLLTRLLNACKLYQNEYDLVYQDSQYTVNYVNDEAWHKMQIKILTNYLNNN